MSDPEGQEEPLEAQSKAASAKSSSSSTEKPAVDAPVPSTDNPSSMSPSVKPSSVTATAKPSGSTAGPRNGPVQATRSFVYTDNGEGSMLYEKDGQWLLDKIPVYRNVQKRTKVDDSFTEEDEVDVEGGNEVADAYNANDMLNGNGGGSTGGGGTVDPAIAAIDAWTGQDSIPCNLCDPPKEKGNDLIPLWNWLYTMVTEVASKAKEYKRNMAQRDVSCGGSESNDIPRGESVEKTLVSTKGTQSTLVVQSTMTVQSTKIVKSTMNATSKKNLNSTMSVNPNP